MRDGFGLGGAALNVLPVAEIVLARDDEFFVEFINQRNARQDVDADDFRVGNTIEANTIGDGSST